MSIRILPSRVYGRVEAPPSKSHTHRALILASLCSSPVEIRNPLLCDDTLATIDAVKVFGSEIQERERSIVVHGRLTHPDEPINAMESGTTLRLMTGVAGLVQGRTTLTARGSLLTRPMGPLLESMEDLGARTSSNNGYPPIEVEGKMMGGKTSIRGDISSQFISSLMISGSQTENGVDIQIEGRPVSRPYLRVTESLLNHFKIRCEMAENEVHISGGQTPHAESYTVPGDFSSASFILSAGALSPGSMVTVTNLTDTAHPDAGIVDILNSCGAEVSLTGSNISVEGCSGLLPVNLDLSDSPDIFPIVCILAAKAPGKSIIRCSHLRFKETDRIKSMNQMLAEIGVHAIELTDGLEIHGTGRIRGGVLPAIDDHRVIMAGAIAGISSEKGVLIQNPETVRKSYPDFFKALRSLEVSLEENK